MNKIKRHLSLILAALMLVLAIPVGDIVSFAAVGELKISTINIREVYNEIGIIDYYLLSIRGSNFLNENGSQRVEVTIERQDGSVKRFNPTVSLSDSIEFKLNDSEISGEIIINGNQIDISNEGLPNLTGRTPKDGIVKQGENLYLEGVNLKFEQDSNTKAFLVKGTEKLKIKNDDENNIDLTEELKEKSGNWGFTIEYNSKIKNGELADVTISTEKRYLNIFKIHQKLDVSDDVSFTPSRAILGSEIEMSGGKLLEADKVSIFFVKNLTDPYNSQNQAKNIRYKKIGNKDYLNFNIPETLKNYYGENSYLGEYHVVLTNNVEGTGDLDSKVDRSKILDEKLILVRDGENVKLIDIRDDYGSSSGGKEVTILGIYINSMSPNNHRPSLKKDDIEVKPSTQNRELVIEYENGEFQDGSSWRKYNKLTRRVKVNIGGNPAEFLEEKEAYRINPQGYDEIKVKIPATTEDITQKKDVIVDIATKIEYSETGPIIDEESLSKETLEYSKKYKKIGEPLLKEFEKNYNSKEIKEKILKLEGNKDGNQEEGKGIIDIREDELKKVEEEIEKLREQIESEEESKKEELKIKIQEEELKKQAIEDSIQSMKSDLKLLKKEKTKYEKTIEEIKKNLEELVDDEISFDSTLIEKLVVKAENSRLEIDKIIAKAATEDSVDDLKKRVEDIKTLQYRESDSFTESDILRSKFKYTPIGHKPEITNVIPDKIPVDKSGNITPDGMILRIIGENFVVHKFRDDNNKEITKYPVIRLGDDIVLNKNSNKDLKLEVKTSNGKIVDGAAGNNIGQIIDVKLKDLKVLEDEIGNVRPLQVTNPLFNSELVKEEIGGWFTGLGETADYTIEFIEYKSDEAPIISSVTPDVVNTNESKEVVIKGERFYDGTKLYIGNKEVPINSIEDSGETIRFNSPLGYEEGDYQVMVINGENLIGIYDGNFSYVKSYTRPEFADYNPKLGTKDTIVTIRGKNFLQSDTTLRDVSGRKINRLIGSRVFFDGEDINEYNDNLEEFTSSNQILEASDGKIELAEYADSMFLKSEDTDENIRYYRFIRDSEYGDIYLIGADNEKKKVTVNNGEVNIDDKKVEFKNSGFNIGDKEYKMVTPYKFSGDDIYGNRVRVKDTGQIEFKVPEKGNPDFYSIEVKNPDEKSVKNSDEGFEYFINDKVLEIENVYPNIGPAEEEYDVIIKAKKDISGKTGERFKSNTKVYIDGIQVNPEKVKLNDKDDYKLEVVVPPYSGRLQNETKLRSKSVLVQVVNEDGASDTLINGYTYMISGSKPDITSLRLDANPVTFKDEVIVTGKRYRYSEPFVNENEVGAMRGEDGKYYFDLNGNGRRDDISTGKIYIPEKDKEFSIDELSNEEFEDYVAPILPKVYFGGKKAKAAKNTFEEISRDIIRVYPPENDVGRVPVYLLNNDFGKSNIVNYEYLTSGINIESIIPNTGNTKGYRDKDPVAGDLGDTPIKIYGKNFVESDMKIIGEEELRKAPLVKFGNKNLKDFSNIDYTVNESNYGDVNDSEINIKIRELQIKYLTAENKLILELKRGDKTYGREINNYNRTEGYIPLKTLIYEEDGKKENLNIEELVKVQVKNEDGINRFIVDRGYVDYSELINEEPDNSIIEIKHPPYNKEGDVDLYVINPGNEFAESKFNYNNSNLKPRVTGILVNGEDISKEDSEGNIVSEVNPIQGDEITIQGKDFLEETTIHIGGIEVDTEIRYVREEEGSVLSKELIFKLPEKMKDLSRDFLYSISIKNDDNKGSTISDPHKLKFTEYLETDPNITEVIPNSGSTEGGTEIVIRGTGFTDEMLSEDGESKKGELKVQFIARDNNGNETIVDVNVKSVSYDKIVATTPPHKPGLVDVKVINMGGSYDILEDGFTYSSNPVIDKIVDPENDKSLINNISIDGGDLIKIKGSDFMDGSKVIFNPDLRPLADNETEASIEGELVVINGKRFELNYDADKEVTAAKQDDGQGQDTYIEFIDGQNLIVKTPTGSIGDSGVIVINPDGAVSNLYNIEYGIPEIGAPMDVQADLIYDEFIRVKWSGVSAANQYEIYVKIEDGDYQFIGSTTETNFAYENIESRTKYRFMVKAIGEYGSSKPLEESESNSVTTGRDADPEDIDGELGEYTNVERQGENANITIGTRDFGSEGYTIDLTRGELAGAKKLSIRMPAEIVSGYGSGEIRILGPDYSMSFRPEVFRNSRIDENRNNNAGVVFNIQPYKGPKGSSTGSIVSGPIYDLNAKVFVGMNGTDVDRLAGGIDLVLDDNPMITQSRRLRNLSLSRYYEAGNNWVNTMRVDRMALYAITGSRR